MVNYGRLLSLSYFSTSIPELSIFSKAHTKHRPGKYLIKSLCFPTVTRTLRKVLTLQGIHRPNKPWDGGHVERIGVGEKGCGMWGRGYMLGD